MYEWIEKKDERMKFLIEVMWALKNRKRNNTMMIQTVIVKQLKVVHWVNFFRNTLCNSLIKEIPGVET